MSKFILPERNRKKSNNRHGEVVRIDCEAYNLLIEMHNDSGLPVGKIANLAIQYAYSNLSYENDVEEDE